MKNNAVTTLCSLIVTFLFVACASAPPPSMARSLEAPEGRMVSYTATITLQVENIEIAKKSLLEKTSLYEGFVTRDSNSSALIRVPYSKYQSFISDLKALGDIPKYELQGQDITDFYNNTLLDLDSAKKMRDKYVKILEKANTVHDALAVEKELERVNLEIQKLEGKKQESEAKVNFVTINVYIEKKTIPGPLGWVFFGIFKIVEWLFIWK